MLTVAKQRALTMVAGERKPHGFSSGKHAMDLRMMPRQESRCLKAIARVHANQFLQRMNAISAELWENLLRDRKDASMLGIRVANIKDADFVRPVHERLRNDRKRETLEITPCFVQVFDQLHASAALANVGLEN